MDLETWTGTVKDLEIQMTVGMDLVIQMVAETDPLISYDLLLLLAISMAFEMNPSIRTVVVMGQERQMLVVMGVKKQTITAMDPGTDMTLQSLMVLVVATMRIIEIGMMITAMKFLFKKMQKETTITKTTIHIDGCCEGS